MDRGSLPVNVLAPSDPKWMAVLGQFVHDFYHLPGYAETCARPIQGETIAFHVDDDGNQLFLPMIVRPLPDFGDRGLEGWRDASSPYGYPGPLIAIGDGGSVAGSMFPARAIHALLDRMQELKILTAFVRFHPLLDTPFDAFAATGELIHHGRTVSIDLRLPTEQIWRQTRRNHRNQITQLRQSGEVAVQHDPGWSHFDQFLRAYQATMDRVGAQQSYYFDPSYYEGLRETLGERVHLFVLRIRDRIGAAAIVTEVCGIVQCHLAASFNEFVKDNPQKLLFYEICLWAKERGNRVLHLGGGVGGREDDLYHFKAGFSPLRHPFHTWRACCNITLYKHVISLWHKTFRPESVDPIFFPPYRQLLTSSRAGGGSRSDL
jgi:hypothetical protein